MTPVYLWSVPQFSLPLFLGQSFSLPLFLGQSGDIICQTTAHMAIIYFCFIFFFSPQLLFLWSFLSELLYFLIWEQANPTLLLSYCFVLVSFNIPPFFSRSVPLLPYQLMSKDLPLPPAVTQLPHHVLISLHSSPFQKEKIN